MQLQPGKSHAYLFAVLCSAIFIFLRYTLGVYLGSEAPLILLTLPVFMSATYGGLGPGLFSTLLCLAGGSYLFLEPHDSFAIAKYPDILRASLFFIEGIIISYFCQRLIQVQNTAQNHGRELEAALAHLESQKEALRLNEMKFRLLVEGVKHYGICLIDAESRFASWNSGVSVIRNPSGSACLLPAFLRPRTSRTALIKGNSTRLNTRAWRPTIAGI